MKKYLAFVVALGLAFVLTTNGLAAGINFDISVFEDSENYTIEFDDMNDTGEITPVESVVCASVTEDEEGLFIGLFDIKITEDYPPVLRINFMYMGEDWIFVDKVIIKPGDTRYTFEVNRDTDVSGGKVIETFTVVLTDESIQMLQDIVDNRFNVRCRLDGERDVDFNLVFSSLEGLKMLLDDYRASGALNNDFSLLKIAYPCEIK